MDSLKPKGKLIPNEEKPGLSTEASKISGSLKQEKPVRTYVIQPGDTLSKIAQAMYGDASRWKEIHQANQDVIANPNVIQVGVTLTIP
ncbi:MAG: LysM peptidoglycan-binding domain-containing protein [Anaerolineae bacterium]|nr:LysM peptidoglycan-binding domain-containing protein [Anaerolineae bacterium]